MDRFLFIKYFEGRATKGEQKQVLAFVRKSQSNLKYFEQAKEEWKRDQEKSISLNTFYDWKQVESKINPQISFGKKTLLKITSAAASIVILLGVSLSLLMSKVDQSQFYIKTEAGQLTEVYLPDSTRVFINSASVLRYSTSFLGLKRKVNLEGEAYFEVNKKEFSEFDVYANQVKVHVTGTQFNVKAYKNEDVSVTLEEGRVELSHSSNPGYIAFMKPGEQIVYNANSNKFRRSTVKIEDYTSWTQGVLYFENNKLPDLLKVLERRYGIKFEEVTDPVLKEFTLTFTIRNEHVESIMNLISSALPVKIITNSEIIKIQLDNEKYKRMNN